MKRNFRVYLRPLKPEDAEVSIHWRRNDKIWESLSGPRYYVSAAYEKHWVETMRAESDTQLVWGVCLKETHELIGLVYLSNIDRYHQSASCGKLIGKVEAWSKGYGTEATLLLLYHAFMTMGLERVESRQITWNHAARVSVLKLGYQVEGVLRRAIYKDGVYEDVNVLSILKEEFLELVDRYRWPEQEGES